jgi:hypothetical protein
MTSPPNPSLTVDIVKQQIAGVSSDPPKAFSDSRNQAESERIELDGRRQFFKLRGSWSRWLIGWITGLLLFHVALTAAIGFDLVDFRDYEWFLPMVVAQNFLQIVGMGFIIVRFLYPGVPTDNKAM